MIRKVLLCRFAPQHRRRHDGPAFAVRSPGAARAVRLRTEYRPLHRTATPRFGAFSGLEDNSDPVVTGEKGQRTLGIRLDAPPFADIIVTRGASAVGASARPTGSDILSRSQKVHELHRRAAARRPDHRGERPRAPEDPAPSAVGGVFASQPGPERDDRDGVPRRVVRCSCWSRRRCRFRERDIEGPNEAGASRSMSGVRSIPARGPAGTISPEFDVIVNTVGMPGSPGEPTAPMQRFRDGPVGAAFGEEIDAGAGVVPDDAEPASSR